MAEFFFTTLSPTPRTFAAQLRSRLAFAIFASYPNPSSSMNSFKPASIDPSASFSESYRSSPSHTVPPSSTARTNGRSMASIPNSTQP
jgi:hypothetical protein